MLHAAWLVVLEPIVDRVGENGANGRYIAIHASRNGKSVSHQGTKEEHKDIKKTSVPLCSSFVPLCEIFSRPLANSLLSPGVLL